MARVLPFHQIPRFGSGEQGAIFLMAEFEVDFEVIDGRLDIRAAPQSPLRSLKVRSPLSVSAVRGTRFRAKFEPKSQVTLYEVTEGKVAILDGDEPTSLGQGDGARIGEGKSALRELLPPPRIVETGRIQTRPELHFSADVPAGARAVRLQVARDADFTDLLAETVSTDGSLILPAFGNGTFFARVSSIDSAGLEGDTRSLPFRRHLLDI
jgi:hypothetical protein